MWDRAIKSNHTSAERARHPLHNYRSVYMSCSSASSSNTALQGQHQLSSPLGHCTKNHLSTSRVGNASNISGPPNGYRKVDSGSASSTMWSRNISSNNPDMPGYSMSNISQQSGRGSVLKNDEDTNDVQIVKSLLAQNFENSNNALCISGRDFSKNAVYTLSSETSRSTASLIQLQGSNLGECIDKGGRVSMPSLLCRQEKVDYIRSMDAFRKNLRDTYTISKQGECSHQSDSTVLLGKKKLDICSTSTKSLMPMSRNEGSFLMPNIHWPAFGPLEEIHLSGAKSSAIDKDMISVKLPSSDAFASAGKGVRRKRVIPEIPDLNIALADLSDAEDVMGNSDPSTNRTKCLETTSLHAVQTSNTGRGIKCRKTSASGSISFEKKSSNLGDSHLHEKVNRSFEKLREGGLNKSELTFSGKKVIVLDSDDGPASVTISGSSSKELIEEKNAKSPSTQGMEKTEDASRLISFGTKSLNLGYSHPDEILNGASRKFREGGVNKSELTYAGKEVIVLDSDDDADDGPVSVIRGPSSKELMEVEKNIASHKNGKSPSAQEMEKTEELTRLLPQNWSLYPPSVPRTAQENPEPTVVHSPQISCCCFGNHQGSSKHCCYGCHHKCF